MVKHKHNLDATVKIIHIRDGEEKIAVLNEIDAVEYWLSPYDKIELSYGKNKIVVNLDVTKKLVQKKKLSKILVRNLVLINLILNQICERHCWILTKMQLKFIYYKEIKWKNKKII